MYSITWPHSLWQWWRWFCGRRGWSRWLRCSRGSRRQIPWDRHPSVQLHSANSSSPGRPYLSVPTSCSDPGPDSGSRHSFYTFFSRQSRLDDVPGTRQPGRPEHGWQRQRSGEPVVEWDDRAPCHRHHRSDPAGQRHQVYSLRHPLTTSSRQRSTDPPSRSCRFCRNVNC